MKIYSILVVGIVSLGVRCRHHTIDHVVSMLDNALVQLLIFLLTLFEFLFVVQHHFFLLSQDLLYDLVLVLTKLIYSLICLNLKSFVFVTNLLQVFEVLVDK